MYKIIEENETDEDKQFDADDENTDEEDSISLLSNPWNVSLVIVDYVIILQALHYITIKSIKEATCNF